MFCVDINDKEDEEIEIKILKSEFPRGSRVKIAKKLGRNPRAFDQSLPLEHSERMTLYLDYNKKNPSEYNVEALHDELRNLKSEMKKLQRWRDFVWQKVPTEEIIEHINDNVDGISQWKQRTLKANIMDIVEGDLG